MQGGGRSYYGIKNANTQHDADRHAEPRIDKKSPTYKKNHKRYQDKHYQCYVKMKRGVYKERSGNRENSKCPSVKEERKNNKRRKCEVAANTDRRKPKLEHHGKKKNDNRGKIFHIIKFT
jgi:hypothetical protein